MTPRYSEVHSFSTNASQPSHLSTYTTDTLRAAIWLQHRRPKAFPAFMTHAAQQFFSLSQCTNLKVFLTAQANPPIYMHTPPTQSTQVFSYNANDPKCPTALVLLPSVLYSIIMSHTHTIIHTT